VVGIRNLIHDRPDPDWLLRPVVQEGLRLLEASGLPFDVVAVLPRHLEIVAELSDRFPALRMVVDHLGEPPFGAPRTHPWWSLLRVVAENPRVAAKVSGLYPPAAAGAERADAVRPYFEHALACFGADRLMYGSDWPISVLAGGYAATWASLTPLFRDLPQPDRAALLGGSAIDFYGIDPDRLAAASERWSARTASGGEG
jgi:L-fuconolactonase